MIFFQKINFLVFINFFLIFYLFFGFQKLFPQNIIFWKTSILTFLDYFHLWQFEFWVTIIKYVFLKLGIRSKNRLIRGDQFHRPLVGPHLKSKQSFVWTCQSKLAPEEIEPETFRGANSKIPSQPLGQPQMGYNNKIC